jgi:hypothetical protein
MLSPAYIYTDPNQLPFLQRHGANKKQCLPTQMTPIPHTLELPILM